MVGKPGLEPGRLAAHDPKSCSSTNSDTSPRGEHGHYSPASFRDAIEHGWVDVRGRGCCGSQFQTGRIAWHPPLSGRGVEVGNERVALCEMVAAWTCSSLLIITHEGTSTNWLLPSSSRRSQRSDTGSPSRRYPSRSYSRIASMLPIATSRLTSSNARPEAIASTASIRAVPTPRRRKAAPTPSANSRSEPGL